MLIDLDPRSKFILSAVLATLAVISNNPLHLGLLLLLAVILLPLFTSDPAILIRRLRPLFFMLLGLVIIQAVFYPGITPLLSWGHWNIITYEGLLQGLSLILRLAIIISCGVILASSPPGIFVQGLVAWRLPYELAYMVSLGIRFLPLLREEAQDIFTALQLRGIHIKELPLGQRFSIYKNLAMPLVTLAILRSRQIAMAMEARAFRAEPQRTFLHKLQLKPRDYAAITVSLTAGILFLILYIRGIS